MGSTSLVTLSQASKTRYFKKLVQLKATVTGKAVLPYQIPKSIRIFCKRRETAKCRRCYINKHWDEKKDGYIRDFEPADPNLAKFINTSEIHFVGIVRGICGVHTRCDSIKVEVLSVHTIEEVYLTEVIVDKPVNSIMRVGYSINKTLECNNPYILSCYSMPDPKTQRISHIIIEAEKLKTSIDDFTLRKSDITNLDLFQPKIPHGADIEESVEHIFGFLRHMYDIYAENITQIYKRFDLHMAIDLVFHSPLQFYFNNELVHKGWLDVMVIGDTRCGKGYVSENLVRYYGLGEVVSGENASFAGLVGGLQQLSGRWVVTWGKIPINNKRLVIIDEAGEMDPRDFGRLSRIRSEGIAEIAKIQTERTQAMTRLIFLTNPKNRMVSSYSFGIEAITDLVESAEDISRFDYVLIVAQSEVDIGEINQSRHKSQNPFKEYDPILTQWVWSRNKDQVIFEKDATDLVLRYAVKLGNTYSPKIPLIQGENIRIKLAKVSAAIAGRLFSHDKTGELLVVKQEHVRAAYVFLNMIYRKSTSGYYYYSQVQKQSDEIYQVKKLKEYIYSFENKENLIDYFIQTNYTNLSDLSEFMNLPKDMAREVISRLLHHKCIQKKYTFYIKNQCFIDWLRAHQ